MESLEGLSTCRLTRTDDAMVLEMVQSTDADRAASQERYDASIADMEANIAKFRGRSGKMSPGIADYLQGVLDDRLARESCSAR